LQKQAIIAGKGKMATRFSVKSLYYNVESATAGGKVLCLGKPDI